MTFRPSLADFSKPTLRLGSKGSETAWAQGRLVAFGFDPGAIDGRFGVCTEEAVRAFQRAYGLKSDGKIGPMTRHLLSQQNVPQTIRMIRAERNSDIGSKP